RATIIADRECLSVCRLWRTSRSYSRQAHRNPQAVAQMGRRHRQPAGHRSQGRRHGVALPVERACARPNLRLALRGAREAHRFSAKGTPRSAAALAAAQLQGKRPSRRGDPATGGAPLPAGQRGKPCCSACCFCAGPVGILPRNSSALLKIRNDSAGIKGGPFTGPPFFVAPCGPLRARAGRLEFTAVGYLAALWSTPCLSRKTLTSFRESETPAPRSGEFSPACPRPHLRPGTRCSRTEVPFFGDFSVMAGGIKTSPAGAEKKLFAGPRRPNTACVHRAVVPIVPRLDTRFSV